MAKTTSRLLSLVAAGVIACVLAGCGQGRVDRPEATIPDYDGSAGFLAQIASQTCVSENEAAHGLLLLMDGDDKASTFGERIAQLEQRSIIAADWDHVADRPLTRGRLAYMIYQACRIPGGLTLNLTGPSQRYALRELQYRQFMTSYGSLWSQVSGMEFVAVIGRADAYLETGEVPQVLANPELE